MRVMHERVNGHRAVSTGLTVTRREGQVVPRLDDEILLKCLLPHSRPVRQLSYVGLGQISSKFNFHDCNCHGFCLERYTHQFKKTDFTKIIHPSHRQSQLTRTYKVQQSIMPESIITELKIKPALSKLSKP